MNDMFKKLLEDKKSSQSKEIGPIEKEATGSVLRDLMQYLNSMQGDKVKGLKKVTVASNDPKGLEEGLNKAKELVGKEGSDDESSEDPMMDDSDDSLEDDQAEDMHDEHSPESEDPVELKKQIEMLKAQLASK